MSDFTKSWAVVIGINDYAGGIPLLKTAANDARRLAELLQRDHDYEVRCLTSDVTAASIRQLLGSLSKEIGPDDRLLFYFAGHGIALDGDDGPAGYLIPQDASREDASGFLPMTELHDLLSPLQCRHLLLILDCCFAGAFRWSSTRDLGALPDVIHRERYERYIQDPAWQVISSAAYDQKALDILSGETIGQRREQGEHSPFAEALFRALEGEADLVPRPRDGQPGGDGVITATELYLYLRDCVETTTEHHHTRQTPGLWPLKKHDKGEYILLAPGHPLNLPPAPELKYVNNPYRGLQSFDEEHSDLFFGRKRIVEELRQRIQTQPMTVVLGASGTGKSSVVKAGLLPNLRTKGDAWQILPPIRPGKSPLAALASLALPGESSDAEEADRLAVCWADEDAFGQRMQAWAQSNSGNLLIVTIDQFEELITLCWDRWERDRFIQLLASGLDAAPRQLRVVVTLRSDFEPQFLSCPLESRWPEARFVVPPMSTDELREAIEGPASVRVLYFEPFELVDRLIGEVVQTPGALPLLSFTLSELYVKYLERRSDDRCLSLEDYESLGGVAGSLRNRAAEVFDGLDAEHQATMKRIMLRMVSSQGGELARRRVPKSELAFSDETENERVKEVLARLGESRLVVEGREVDGNPYVEPAHDELVRGWDRLLTWTREEQEELSLRRLLTPAANDWHTHQGGTWHTNPRLSLLNRIRRHDESWLNDTESRFVARSTSKRRSIFAVASTLVVAAFLTLSSVTYYALTQRNEVRAANRGLSRQLRASEAMRLAALSENVPASHPQRRSLLATVSLRSTLPDDPLVTEAQDALREALAQCTGRPLASCESQVELFLTNADETMLVTSGERAHINDFESHDVPRLWDLTTLESKAMPAADHITISHNSKWLATAHPDAVRLWHFKHNDVTGSPDVLRAEEFEPYRVAFSPDHQYLIAVEEFGNINVWDVESRSLVQSIGTAADFIGFEGRVMVTPDSRWVVCDRDDGGTFMCRLGVADAKLIRWPASEWPGGDWLVDKEGLGTWTEHRFAPISPDGHYVFSSSERYDLHADDPSATRSSTDLEEDEFPIAVHPKSTHLATIYGDAVRVRPLNSSGMPGEAKTIFSHGDLLTAKLSPSWEYLIVALRGGRIAVYDQPLEDRAITSVAFERLLHGIEGRILRVFLCDSWVALTTSDGPPRIWNLSRFGKQRSFVGLHGGRMVIQSAAHQSEDDTSKILDTTDSDAVLLNHERNTYRLELHSLEMSNPFAAMQPAGIHIKSALANGWGIVEPKSANYELINLLSSSNAARSDHNVVSFRKYQYLTSRNNQHLIHWKTSSENDSRIVAVTGVALSAGKLRSHEYRIVSRSHYTTIPIAVSDDGNYLVTKSASGRSLELWRRGETTCRRVGSVDVDWTKGGDCGVWTNKSHVALYLLEQRMFAEPRLLLWPSVVSGRKETVGRPREVPLKVQDGAWPKYANFWKVTRNGHRALAYDDVNKQMLIWDLRRTPPTLVRLRAELNGIPRDQLALSRDENLLAVAQGDGELVIWDLAEVEGGQLEPSHRLVDHQGQVSHLSIAADGEVVVGCFGANARLWRLENGVPNPRSMLFAHNANLNRADYFVDAAGRDWLITQSHAVTNWDSFEGVARVSAWPLHTKVLREMSSLLIGRKLTEFERRTFRVDAQ